ncbi:adenylate/guanylate cyclase domain-containing protein [Actinomadura oligospora]|uniref:adenylate/guanylate cyclase domain-containing protein n=1 Tax=Actinomadura oligospora TaxID=111804 RepID=UPI00047D9C67|nr:adenylate/guanylate cyclase domain-containing protein [Actinomadura oligospora]
MVDPQVAQEIEETLLADRLKYTRAQVEELAGMPPEKARRIWQTLGFPAPSDDEVAFTEGDVRALVEIDRLVADGLVDEEGMVQLVRAVGQTMGRLASWVVDVWLPSAAARLPEDVELTPETMQDILGLTEQLRPRFEWLLLQGWRRQLAAAGLRVTAAAAGDASGSGGLGVARLAVGFADIVSFTSLSRRMEGPALAEFVERFEAVTAETVADLGGRIVKTLGDEAFFVAPDPRAVAEIGLSLADRHTSDPDFPVVRVGLAYGEVVLRLGDVFGTPVNLAARLTAAAHRGTILIDAPLAAELADADYDISPLRARHLQGLGRVRPYRLRRPLT